MDLITTILIIGAAQGLFLTLLLVTKQTNTTANRILAAAMAAYSLFLLAGAYYARAWYLGVPYFIGWSIPLVFLFGPLHYLYALALSSRGEAIGARSLLHFLPGAIVIGYLLPFYFRDGRSKLAYLDDLILHGPPRDLTIIEQLQFIHGIIYVALTILLLRRHRARLRDNYSSVERINLLWLRNLTIGIAIVWAIATTMNILDLAGIGLGGFEGTVTPIGVACLVYAAGYLGLKQPEIFHGGRPGQVTPPPMPIPSAAPAQEAAAGYEKSGLTPSEAAALMQQLQALMGTRKLYLDGQLTLQDLADQMGISAHNLSEVINTQADRNFYDFVNHYRVEEAMARLRDPKYAHLTILAIAGDSGFNAKATFNAFFKRHTGLTPSAFRTQA